MPNCGNAVSVKSAVLEALAVTVCVAGCGAGRGLRPSADGGIEVFAATAGVFVATGSMTTPRALHTATLLPGGKVLITGGISAPFVFLASAELYDPNMGRFAATGGLTVPRINHTATLLQNGKVLIVGGSIAITGEPVVTGSAELYDPETGTFATTGSMGAARSGHVATMLPDGKVLVAGGNGDPAYSPLLSAEIFDPSVGTFMPTGRMVSSDAVMAQLLPNGMVLIDGSSAPADAALFDEIAGVFTLTGNMTMDRGGGFSATLLQTGNILVAGGDSTGKSAEIYVPAAGTFIATGSMSASKSGPTGTLLPNGTVLVAGGVGASGLASTASAELYDAGTGAFSATASMTAPRCLHTATLLPNGMVLVAGGKASLDGDVANDMASAELYE